MGQSQRVATCVVAGFVGALVIECVRLQSERDGANHVADTLLAWRGAVPPYGSSDYLAQPGDSVARETPRLSVRWPSIPAGNGSSAGPHPSGVMPFRIVCRDPAQPPLIIGSEHLSSLGVGPRYKSALTPTSLHSGCLDDLVTRSLSSDLLPN
jgi:hypothetical protein